MTGKEAKYVLDTIENEGFDYCFIHYDDFKAVKDEEFHKRREEFVQARKQLAEYCGYEG